MSRAVLKNVEIAYNIHGNGKPVILIGGFNMVKESWDSQIKGLSDHFQVITYDNRGVGESTVPVEDFTIADMASDVTGLMDTLEIDSAYIFGVSLGGLIAQILSLDYPNRVKKVALGCTTHGGRHAVMQTQEVRDVQMMTVDPDISAEKAVRINIPLLYSERFIREEPERLEALVRAGIKYFPPLQGRMGQLKALSVFNVKRRLNEINCPVLAITGNEDKSVPPENSNLLTEGIHNARLYIVEGAGHIFFQEKPEEVNSVLIDFFCL